MARGKDIVIQIPREEHAVLERWATEEDRTPWGQARFLLVGLLRERAEREHAEASVESVAS